MYNDEHQIHIGVFFATFIVCVFVIGVGFWAFKSVQVWSAAKSGEAELAHAEWNRKIAIREADAKRESAKLLAEAEITRAKGVAEANKIIGESLKTNERYLQYLWVQTLEHNQNNIIYVPTEANLPILEATRRQK